MEPSATSAVPAASTAVAETASDDGRTTAPEVNSTQALPPPAAAAAGSPGEERPQQDTPSSEKQSGSSASQPAGAKKAAGQLAKPAQPDDSRALPASSSSSSSSSSGGKTPEISTTTSPDAVDKRTPGEAMTERDQSEAASDGRSASEGAAAPPAPTSSNSCVAPAKPRSSAESIPTSSSGADEPTPAGGPPAPAATPPPQVESSTASPENRQQSEGESEHAPPPPDAGMADSSSGRSPAPTGRTADLINGGSQRDGSDNVNSISTDCSSSSSSSSRSGAGVNDKSHQRPNRGANAANEAARPALDGPSRQGSFRAPPTVVDTAAVIDDKAPAPPAAARGEQHPSGGASVPGAPEPPTSSELKPTKCVEGGRAAPAAAAAAAADCLPIHGRRATQDQESSVGSSTNGNTHAPPSGEAGGCKLQADSQPLESRESVPVPPEPDPGPSSSIGRAGERPPPSQRTHDAALNGSSASTQDATDVGEGRSSNSDSNKSTRAPGPAQDERTVSVDDDEGGEDGGAAGIGSTNGGTDFQQHAAQPPATPNARNPLLFTEVANDEVELKVDGGHLLDRVIKLSLLKGLQDGGKRLAKSSLIISGASAANGEGSNGEATLATTSSLSKAKSAAGLRLVEETSSKTTPPALVATGSLTNGERPPESAPPSVRELASSTKEVLGEHLAPPPQRVRHTSETIVSSGSGEIVDDGRGGAGCPAWNSGSGNSSSGSSSNSALDFREDARPTAGAATQDPPAATAAANANTAAATLASSRTPAAREPVVSSDSHFPVKARKAQYFASIPDFSKQSMSKFSTAAAQQPPSLPPSSVASSSTNPSSTTTGSSVAAKSLTQLHMKTPDFSRLTVGTVSSSAPTAPTPGVAVSSQSSSPVPVASSAARTTSELKISNPDFTKVHHHSFAPPHHHPLAGSATGGSYPGSSQPQPSGASSQGGGSPYVSLDTFSKLIKERNYIADLQLKNPPPSNGGAPGGAASSASSTSSSRSGSHIDGGSVKARNMVVVDTTTSSSGGSMPKASSSPYEAIAESSSTTSSSSSSLSSSSYHQRQPAPSDNGMDLEPQAHVIHKKFAARHHQLPGSSSSSSVGGGGAVPKNWNPPEFSSSHFTHPAPQPTAGSGATSVRPSVSANGGALGGPPAGAASSSSSSPSPAPRDPSPAPSSSSSSSSVVSPYPGAGYGVQPYPPGGYPGKHVAPGDRIIVNNVRTYYPEHPASGSTPPAGSSAKPQQHYHHSVLPKVKDPEFRLDHGKEQQLLQEGTIITVKQSYAGPTPAASSGRPTAAPAAARSPSAERREAQMMQNSQEILFRDYRAHKRPSSAGVGGSRAQPGPQGPAPSLPPPSVVVGSSPQGPPPPATVGDRGGRSPYDSSASSTSSASSASASAYYHPMLHHPQHRGPSSLVHPQQNAAGSPAAGLMHPPPPNWPAGPAPPSQPHRGAMGDNGTSPASSPAPPSSSGSTPSPNPHHYHLPPQHPHLHHHHLQLQQQQQHQQQQQQRHGGQYKTSPSTGSAGSAYGVPVAAPVQPSGTPTSGKYAPQQAAPYAAPSSSGEQQRRPEGGDPYGKTPSQAAAGYYKGLDYNMEQKFAEVYQEHQAKEKQAAAELHATSGGRSAQPSSRSSASAAPRGGNGSPGVSSASASVAGGGPPKAPYGAYDPAYNNAYYHHPQHPHHHHHLPPHSHQATPSPTSTPSPVPSPHHRSKYGGPPSRDPSPLGQHQAAAGPNPGPPPQSHQPTHPAPPGPPPPAPPPSQHRYGSSGSEPLVYHVAPGYSGPAKPMDTAATGAANGSLGHRGAPQQPPGGPQYHHHVLQHVPSPSSGAYPMPTAPYAGGNPPQPSVISTAYDRYQPGPQQHQHQQPQQPPPPPPPHSYAAGPSHQGPHHAKPHVAFGPQRGQQQSPVTVTVAGPPQPTSNVAPAGSSSATYYPVHHPPALGVPESAIIHPPIGSKNIPVRVIATAPPATGVPKPAATSGLVSRGTSSAMVPEAAAPAAASQGVVQVALRIGAEGGASVDNIGAAGVGTVAAVIMAPTKRESPLDLSVKTVKTKADSTGCDDYGSMVTASNSSISSSSSSSSSSTSSNGAGVAPASTAPNRSRIDVLPKVDFSPNFNKHIPPVPHSSRGGSSGTTAGITGVGGQPETARPVDPLPAPSSRHVSVISPAIPPGYDKKTDAYMSTNYRAVGGPLVSPAYQYAPYASRAPPAGYEPPSGASAPVNSSMQSSTPSSKVQHAVDPFSHLKQPPSSSSSSPSSLAPAPGSVSGSASSKSVYYPPPAASHPSHPPVMEYVRKSVGGGSIVTGQAPNSVPPPASTQTPSSSASRPVSNASPATTASALPPPSPRKDDPRIEDRKFVENVLKKQTSPSSDVIADLQSGRFPTRLPQNLVPKKRAIAAAAAAAAAEAAQQKAAAAAAAAAAGRASSSPSATSDSGGPPPAKVGRYEERREHAPETTPPPSSFERPHYPPAVAHPASAATREEQQYHGSPSHSVKPYGTAGNVAAPDTAVHPSVITTNYHHNPTGDRLQSPQQQPLQQQHQPHQQYPPDMRYYRPHSMPPGGSKPRDDPAAGPVYHQPHLRGGSSLAYSYHPSYHHPEHPQQQQQQPPAPPPHLAYQQHKDQSGQPFFRYGGEPPKSSPESTSAVLHVQSHIHYTGSGVPSVRKEYNAPQQPLQPPYLHPHPQQQGLPSPQGNTGLPSGGVEMAPAMIRSPYGGGVAGPAAAPSSAAATAAPVPLPLHRGADQSVISKLRESLEHKEYEKQRISQLRKQPSGGASGGDLLAEESQTHPLQQPQQPTTPGTPDAPSSSSARFRTKGELKGYTPLPLPPTTVADVATVAKREGDDEPIELVKDDDQLDQRAPPAGNVDGPAGPSPLLDILDWGSACNEFVEQLQTGKKRGRRKRTSTTPGWHGLGQPPDTTGDGQLMEAGSSADLSAVPKDVLNSARSPPGGGQQHRQHRSGSSSDEDKPLLLLRQQSQQEQQKGVQDLSPHHLQHPHHPSQQQVFDSHTRSMVLSTVEKLTDKLARNIREKQRLEQEQKHEAKLGRSSSTDSDTARLASAAAQRAKARVRKLRHRSSIMASACLKSSDADGDVTADEDEGGSAVKGAVGKRPPVHPLTNAGAAKKKRLDRRSSCPSSASSAASSSEGEQEQAEQLEPVLRRKRGRPKGSLGGAKRAQQQATMTRCQTGQLKQDPNENSDLSSDDDKPSKALRTPPAKGDRGAASGSHGRAVVGSSESSSAKKHRGGDAGNGGTSAGGSSKGQQQVKLDQSSTAGGGTKTEETGRQGKPAATDKERKKNATDPGTEQAAPTSGSTNGPASSSSKRHAKQRTTSRSKTPQQGRDGNSAGRSSVSSGASSASSSSGSSSSSSSEEEEEEAEQVGDRETMTRSKSKREAERRRSNSKVLRNDKIVENLSIPPAANSTRRARLENERTPTKHHRQASKNSRDTPSSAGKRPKPVDSDSDKSARAPGSATATTTATADKAGPRKRTRLASKNAHSSSAESEGESSSNNGEDGGTAGGTVELSERLRSRRSKNGSDQAGAASGKSATKTGGPACATKGSRSRRESTAAKSGKEESSAKKNRPVGGSSGPAGGSGSSGGGGGSGARGSGTSRKGSLKDGAAGAGGAGGAAAPDHFYPGWEKELYEYKRSLKVPPELITIGGGLYMHRISTSLPDLDSPHHSDGSETFSEIVKKLNQKDVPVVAPPSSKRVKTKAVTKQQQQQQQTPNAKTPKIKEEPQTEHQREHDQRKKKLDDNEKFSSIIELLHRRCVATVLLHQSKVPATGVGKQKGNAKGGAKANAALNNNNNNTSNSNNNNNNNEITVKPKQEFELLPTPGAESESLFAKNCKKKKSLFDTAILKSRTRTEQKAMQSKEMIREVFGADGERPQSAPPLGCGALFEEGIQNVTYDEKYNELMRNVDRIVGELDGGGSVVTVKQEPPTDEPDEEEDEEEEEEEEEEEDERRMAMDEDDETQDSSVLMKDSERDTPSIASERDLLGGTPLSFGGGPAVSSTPALTAPTAVSVASGTPGSTSAPTASTGELPSKKRRGRGHRASRRKGSSGFDYIRKKKKPSQQHHSNHGNHGNHQQRGGNGSSANVNGINGFNNGEPFPRKKIVSAFENLEVKDETHISKEIRSWVLNKGVGESVMHKAARLGYTDVIVYCLERLDMDPDLKDNAGYTPLHEACAKGHLDIAHYLLQYGASHSEPAPSGMRPLHEAVENSFVEIVRLLLAFGADPMLATYAGLTPEQLSESDSMTRFLKDHLLDVQSMGPNKTTWRFDGAWNVHDPEESGCNVFSNMPEFGVEESSSGVSSLNSSAKSNSTVTSGTGTTTVSSPSGKQCDSNSNIMNFEAGSPVKSEQINGIAKADGSTSTDGGAVPESPAPAAPDGGLRNGKVMKRKDSAVAGLVNGFAKGNGNRTKLANGGGEAKAIEADVQEENDEELHDDENDGTDGPDGMVFEYEESDRPLPPLYALKDEHNERWVLMSDLCHVLKFKSKEAVLRQICPNNSVNNQRDLIREMKIEEFLARANCLQLLCAGEKLNIHASKVVLVKYNDSVKSLLQVNSVITRI